MRDVTDVNVLRVANAEASHVGIDCQIAAVDYLLAIRDERGEILDDLDRVLMLYSGKVSYSGQPGVGDEFFRWLHQSIGVLERVTLTEHQSRGFQEFPDDDELHTFDPDDRLYVALTAAAGDDARLANAVDSDYKQHYDVLSRYIEVHELCPDSLK